MKYAKVTIDSFGYELAPNVVTSEDLEILLDPVYQALHLKLGQLENLTGIYERRFWDKGYKMADGATAAGRKALDASGISSDKIGMLVYGGVCRDNFEPATACAVADGLGLPDHTQIFDVSNACLGVVTGMIQIANAIELGQIEAGLVVSCETARQIVDVTIQQLLANPSMALFIKSVATLTGGSGAVAVVLTHKSLSSNGHRLIGGVCRNATAHHRLCLWGPDAGEPVNGVYVMKTDSVGVLQNGVTLGSKTYAAFKHELGLSDDKPDKVICHQVGSTHQKQILESIGISPEKDFPTYPYLGNIGTVSLPITAAIASEREFLAKHDLVGFLGIASGLNCIMMAVEW
jgi:3-oxoacyl-[acyl-carrier-protein] synthase III